MVGLTVPYENSMSEALVYERNLTKDLEDASYKAFAMPLRLVPVGSWDHQSTIFLLIAQYEVKKRTKALMPQAKIAKKCLES